MCNCNLFCNNVLFNLLKVIYQGNYDGKKRTREEIAQYLAAYERQHGIDPTTSQRALADQLDIPRTTLQHWLERKATIDADPSLVAFFESPVGVAFLHRLVVALQFVLTLLGGNGPRLVCTFLELAGLDPFVASSYGAQQQITAALEEAVGTFGQAERERLSAGMKPKEITVCEDETFHPEMCLVAIEPVSNFIVVEQYAPDRSAATWTQALKDGSCGMPVTVIQSTSDEARGIVHHVQADLSAHHSPDIFHVQHEVVKGVSGALAGQTRKAESAVADAAAELQRHHAEQAAAAPGERKPGRPPQFERRIQAAEAEVAAAQDALKTAVGRQEQAKAAVQGLSLVYHPYDLA